MNRRVHGQRLLVSQGCRRAVDLPAASIVNVTGNRISPGSFVWGVVLGAGAH
jgi:hypothetical protein